MANYTNNLGQIRLGWRTAVSTTPVNTNDVDATTFITAAGITDSTQISAINTLVSDLKTYGLWTKMKAIYPFVGGSATSHKWNLKDPRDLDAAYRLVFSGGWTHTSTGAKPNGTTGYADTKLIPSVNISNVNSVSISNYSRTQDTSFNGVQIGCYDGSNGQANELNAYQYYSIISRKGGSSYQYSIEAVLSTETNTKGFLLNSRTSSSIFKLFFNNNLLNTNTTIRTGNLPTRSLYIGASNWFNGTNQYSPHEHAFDSIGDGLTDTEASNFYISVQKFQTTLGRHVGTPYVSDPDAIAFLMAAGITDSTQAAAINTLVIRMKADGVWTKMKAIYPFVGGSATSHKWNLKDPRDLDAAYRLVFSGGWTHTGTGAQPNGTTGYAETYLNPAVVFTDFKNNGHLSLYSRTENPIGPGWNIGVGNAEQTGDPLYGLSIKRPSWNGYTNPIMYDFGNYTGNGRMLSVGSDARGFWIGSTTASNSHRFYKDGSIFTSNTNVASGNISNASFHIGKINNTSGSTFYGLNNELSIVSIGDGLTDTESINLYSAVQSFQTTLGRQVSIPKVSDTDAQAFLDAANITSFQQASAVNKLVVDLKAAGVWTKMKAIYPFVGGSAVSHKFNLKDPRDLDAAYRLAFNGGWTHTSTGAKPNGSNGYADTFVVPKNVFNATTFNHVSYYSRTNSTLTTPPYRYDLGVDDYNSSGVYYGGLSMIIRRDTNATLYSSDYGTSATYRVANTTTSDSLGLFIGSQTGTNIKLYKNNSILASNTQASISTYNMLSPLATRSIWIGTMNELNYTTQNRWTDKESAFISIGEGLNDTEATALYTAVQTYQTSLGRAVNTPVYNNGLVLNLDAGNANSYPGTGTTWFDLASGNNGTLTNGPTYDNTNGGSLLFDGTNDFSGHPIINFGTSSVSWSFWIKPNRYVSTYESFIGQGAYPVNGGGMVIGSLRGDTGTKRIQFSITSDPQGVNMKSVILDNSYTINTWINIVVTYNSSNRDLFLYINGIKQNATTTTTGNFGNTSISQNLSPTNTSGRMLSLCMYDESRTVNSFSGNMATTQIYFRTLSDTEVLNYFNSTRGRFGL